MTMTTTVPSTIEVTTPRWRGINHLALITTDMDATVRFYHGTLGARIVGTVGTPEFRHYFFDFGPQCTVAFFEYLPDEDALVELQQRLRSAACEVTDIIDHGGVRSVYFTDPNGIALEASWWVHDSTGRRADYDNTRTFADPDPVPALQELAATGTLATVPSTRLA